MTTTQDLAYSIIPSRPNTTITLVGNVSHFLFTYNNGKEIHNGSLEIHGHASSSNTVINDHGREILTNGAHSTNTVINSFGLQFLLSASHSSSTLINDGGIQYVGSASVSSDTIINKGGIEVVDRAGVANRTTINDGGFLVAVGNIEEINFGANSHTARVNVVDVTNISGTISNWQAGDIIHVDNQTSVSGDNSHITLNGTTTLSLSDLQAGMKVVGVASSQGGTDLVLAPI